MHVVPSDSLYSRLFQQIKPFVRMVEGKFFKVKETSEGEYEVTIFDEPFKTNDSVWYHYQCGVFCPVRSDTISKINVPGTVLISFLVNETNTL